MDQPNPGTGGNDQEPTTNPTKTSVKLPVDYKTRHEAFMRFMADGGTLADYAAQHPDYVAAVRQTLGEPRTHMDYLLSELLTKRNFVQPITREEQNILAIIEGASTAFGSDDPSIDVNSFPRITLSFGNLFASNQGTRLLGQLDVITPLGMHTVTEQDFVIEVPLTNIRTFKGIRVGLATVIMYGWWSSDGTYSDPLAPTAVAGKGFDEVDCDGSTTIYAPNGEELSGDNEILVNSTTSGYFFQRKDGLDYDYDKILCTLTFEVPSRYFDDDNLIFNVGFSTFYSPNSGGGGVV